MGTLVLVSPAPAACPLPILATCRSIAWSGCARPSVVPSSSRCDWSSSSRRPPCHAGRRDDLPVGREPAGRDARRPDRRRSRRHQPADPETVRSAASSGSESPTTIRAPRGQAARATRTSTATPDGLLPQHLAHAGRRHRQPPPGERQLGPVPGHDRSARQLEQRQLDAPRQHREAHPADVPQLVPHGDKFVVVAVPVK